MFFKECVHTHCKSVVPQVGGLAGVLLSSLRLGGISECGLMSRSPDVERDLHLLAPGNGYSRARQAPPSCPRSAGLRAGLCSQWQLDKHRLMN